MQLNWSDGDVQINNVIVLHGHSTYANIKATEGFPLVLNLEGKVKCILMWLYSTLTYYGA